MCIRDRACAQQLTKVSSQSDEWYRNAYGTKKERNKQTFIFIDIDYKFNVCTYYDPDIIIIVFTHYKYFTNNTEMENFFLWYLTL